MANVVEIPFGGSRISPSDTNAIYVWAATTGPMWGLLTAFQHASPPKTRFAEHDWITAIEAAVNEAERLTVPTVYVVRNA